MNRRLAPGPPRSSPERTQNRSMATETLTQETPTAPETEATSAEGQLSPRDLLRFYRLMVLSRRTDDREIVLKRQQKIFFQISCAGHEALLVAAGMALQVRATTGSFPYYRDRAISSCSRQSTVEEQLLQAVGAASDPASGGRQMPSHWSSSKALQHRHAFSSSTATQCLHAIGCAEAGMILCPRIRKQPPRKH